MPCKHAALAAIYAQQMAEMDEPWKLWEFNNCTGWEKCDMTPLWHDNHEYRQIPKTIKIGNYDVPEPMREKPEIGTAYHYIYSGCEDGVTTGYWHNSKHDNNRLKRGDCHLTRDNCIAHAKALFSFSEVE